ncbi:hypothetical protein KM043_007982 [Ampulex compressa]|nr:hypothetical protein KM043_007982 [Ampulex compressa]
MRLLRVVPRARLCTTCRDVERGGPEGGRGITKRGTRKEEADLLAAPLLRGKTFCAIRQQTSVSAFRLPQCALYSPTLKESHALTSSSPTRKARRTGEESVRGHFTRRPLLAPTGRPADRLRVVIAANGETFRLLRGRSWKFEDVWLAKLLLAREIHV